MFAGNFAPRGWAFCDGQLLAVSQNDALFSLFGTIYGGDGRTTFGLPDMRGRVPVHAGQGPGLPNNRLGEKAGAESVTVTAQELPSHTHQANGVTGNGSDPNPGGTLPASSTVIQPYFEDPARQPMNNASITAVGGSREHTNLQPFLCVHFIVALFGIYPSRH